jgi:hypothetical protein
MSEEEEISYRVRHQRTEATCVVCEEVRLTPLHRPTTITNNKWDAGICFLSLGRIQETA